MAKNLIEEDYINASKALDVEVAVIKAVKTVESNGSGFFDDGRPKILFEAHLFHKFTNGDFDITHPHISSPKWNKALYKGGIKEYDRYTEAYKLNSEAAMLSTSFGLFQILGMNYKACGFNNVSEFVDKMFISEFEHLMAFVKFVRYNGLQGYLATKRWDLFAKGYNGPSYQQNKYDIKLADAYNKFKFK